MSELGKLIGRVVNLVRTAVITRVDDSKGIQELQATALEDEGDDAIPYMQPYGLSFVPPVDAEVLLASVGADVMNRVALGAQKRGARPTDAKEGEGGLYRLDGTWALFLAEDGTVHAGKKDPDDAAALASVADSRFDALQQGLNDLVTAFNAHTHVAPMGGTTPPASPAQPVEPGQTTASATLKVQS